MGADVGATVRLGVAAGVLSGLPSALGWAAGHGRPLEATREIGRFWTGRPSLVAGAGGHLAVAVVLAAPAPLLGRVRFPVVVGAAYGAALYGVNFGLLAPRLWPAVRAYAGPFQVADHIAYGIALIVLRRHQRPG